MTISSSNSTPNNFLNKNPLGQKKKISKVSLIIFLGCLGFLLWFLGRAKENATSTSSKNFGRVTREDLVQRVTIAGTVSPLRKTLITAPYNGYIKKLFVQVGDVVKAGDPLVSLSQSLQSTESEFPLRAPFKGVVVQIEKREGEFVKEGDSKFFILRIDDTEKMFITALAPEIDRAKIKLNQSAIVKASAVLDHSYKGILRELSLSARDKEEWSRSQVIEFPIKIEILDFDQRLRSGMSVIADIITDKREKVLTLRHEYLRHNKDEFFVYLKGKERRVVKVGLQNEEVIEIVEGLKEGDFVELVDFSELKDEG